MSPINGQHIKGYELKERIAAGGFGAVYRAHQTTIGREVAIKVILPGLANRPDFIRRFEAEAQMIARLEHMNIVPLYDYWRDPDGAYLVMRYLRGGSLRGHIRRNGRLGVEETFNLLAQIAQGLHIAHRNQIVHRDIKPGNILLDEDGNAYIGDFGIAQDQTTADSITEVGNLVGSPEYLAPEQARSEPVTPRTDIYSLGVVLYEMLTGEHPFESVDKITYIFKHLNDPLPEIISIDDKLGDDINDVIQKATAKDPKQRFADVIEMMEALRSASRLDSTPTPISVVELLTPREQEVMQLIIDGKTNRQIADILVLTEGTVKQYITSIYRKLNVRSRVQAIARAKNLDFVIKKPEASPINTDLLPGPQNPYKGLQAFQAGDNRNFFGREKLVQKLIRRLQEDVIHQRFLAVVGPSGSGKSSVVKAGLIPALWRGEHPGSEDWYTIELFPGNHPLDELEIALFQITTEKSLNLYEQLQRDERGLVRVANLILPDENSELLIIIDQFEELFTLVHDEAERLHFLKLLRSAVTETRSRVRIIVTLRADYYDRPLQYAEFGDLIRDRVETVLPLSAEELERAINEPASQQGVKFQEGLVSRIVSDVHYQPGALPLLQYALTELFERRDKRVLTVQAYQDIGGTGGALANRADELYLEGDDTRRNLIQQMFLRLVTLGEGAEDTRRRTDRAELLEIAKQPEIMDEIIDLYAQSRLLSLDHDPATRQPTVEVAHEAILREWDRLRAWLNESREDIRQERLIAQSAQAWQDNQRDASYLLSGARLEQAEAWQANTKIALTSNEIVFITSSIANRVAITRAEAERQQRETKLEKRSRDFSRGLIAVLTIGLFLSGILGLVANSERVRAEDNERQAITALDIAQRSGQAFAANAALETEEIDLAIALALESVGDDEANMLPETMRVLERIENRSGPKYWQKMIGSCIVGRSRANHYYALADCENRIQIWDMSIPEIVTDITSDELQDALIVFSDDNSQFLSYPGNKSFVSQGVPITIWDLISGEILASHIIPDALPHDLRIKLTADNSAIAAITIKPENVERYLQETEIIGDSIVLYDVESGEFVREYRFDGEMFHHFDFSPDGKLGLTLGWTGFDGPGVDDFRVLIFDVETGDILQVIDREAVDPNTSLSYNEAGFSVDSSKIWIGGYPGYLIDLQTGENIGIPPNPEQSFWMPPDADFETITKIQRNDSAGLVVNVITGETHTLDTFNISLTSVKDTVLTRDLGRMDEFQLWDLNGRPSELFTASMHLFNNGVRYSPDGQWLATVSADWGYTPQVNTELTIYDAHTVEVQAEFIGEDKLVPWALAWSPDSHYLATGTMFGEVILRDGTTFEVLHRLSGTLEHAQRLAFSNDNRTVIGAHGSLYGYPLYEQAPYLVMWDVESGEEVKRIELPFEDYPVNAGVVILEMHPFRNEAFVGVHLMPSADIAMTDSYYVIIDLDTGEILHRTENRLASGMAPLFIDARYTPDGNFLVMADYFGEVHVFDASTLNSVRQFGTFENGGFSLAMSNDGKYVATGSGLTAVDTAVSLWDFESGRLLRRYFGHQDQTAVLHLDFHPDGTKLATSAIERFVRVWDVDPTSTLEWVRQNRAMRDLTCAERAQYRIEPLCGSEG